MIRIAALKSQQSLRDLGALPKLCDEVVWCNSEQLTSATDPALVVGLWLAEEPTEARRLIENRTAAGLCTILVPRFHAGDLRSMLNAPSAVRVKIGEYEAFLWDDGTSYQLPGQTVIETSLHRGQWGGVAGLGVTVLAYRINEAAGAIVLCTAGLTSRRFGVSADEQRSLLAQIVRRSLGTTSKTKADEPIHTPQLAASIEELLLSPDPNVATVLLAVALNGGDRDHEQTSDTLKRIGFDLSSDTVIQTLARLPDSSVDDLETALRNFGWGAFLRRGRLALAEGGQQ
jgi:hypothetical protein